MEDERAPSALLGQYEKFPLYIEFTLKPPTSIFNSNLMYSYNKYAINEVFNQKEQELIYLKSFPISFRI